MVWFKIDRVLFNILTMAERDLVVLGSGPGGYVAAIKASQLGRKVTIVERDALGGICLNWGCIPSKALLSSAKLVEDINHADSFGITVSEPKVDFGAVIKRSRDVAGKLSGGVSYLMKKNKIEVIKGNGILVGNNTLAVSGETFNDTIKYKDIIIAVGARARQIPGFEVDGKLIHTYRTILEHQILPMKSLIIGAGAIGIEFGYFHQMMGADVTVVEMQDQILPIEDSEIAGSLQKELAKKGMNFALGTTVEKIAKNGNVAHVTLKDKSGKITEWQGDCVLVAIGVVPNTENIGIDKVGIQTERGFIKVDGHLKTSVPNHYAIGDCVATPLLAHVASHEGIVAAQAASGVKAHPIDYTNIPSCTYCVPQVASIGYTEDYLKKNNIPYKHGKMPFSAVGKAIATGHPEGMVKVLIDPKVGEILGVHILHAYATELISEAAIIRSHEGIALSVLDTIHPHPTLSEAVMEAVALANGTPINY